MSCGMIDPVQLEGTTGLTVWINIRARAIGSPKSTNTGQVRICQATGPILNGDRHQLETPRSALAPPSSNRDPRTPYLSSASELS